MDRHDGEDDGSRVVFDYPVIDAKGDVEQDLDGKCWIVSKTTRNMCIERLLTVRTRVISMIILVKARTIIR